MIVYIPTSGENVARSLSNALWSLVKPVSIRGSDVTQEMFSLMEMANNSVWLQVDTDFTITVHAEAELDGIADILQPYIDAGQLPADTNTVLAAFIESKRGDELIVYNAFPQFFKDQAKTQEQLQTLGLWPSTP